MTTYGNPKSPRTQSLAGTAASVLQAELVGFGVPLTHEDHFELQRLVAKYGPVDVRAVAMKALDRYTEGADGAAGTTAEKYIMERLSQHNWGRNNHK